MAGRFIRWRLRTLGSLFSSAQERSRRTNVITRLAGAICLALLVTLVGLVSAQTLESRVADALSVQWGRIDSRPGISRPGIEGYVHNDSSYRIGLVRLRVLTRDESGHTQPHEADAIRRVVVDIALDARPTVDAPPLNPQGVGHA